MTLTERYAASLEHLARAEAVIPLGAQTFSKSRTQYPVGAAPFFAARSQGSHTWDIDGNEYVGERSAYYGNLPDQRDGMGKRLDDGVV